MHWKILLTEDDGKFLEQSWVCPRSPSGVEDWVDFDKVIDSVVGKDREGVSLFIVVLLPQ